MANAIVDEMERGAKRRGRGYIVCLLCFWLFWLLPRMGVGREVNAARTVKVELRRQGVSVL